MFNFYIHVKFPVFLLLLISSFIPLCLEKINEIISVFLNFKDIYKFLLLVISTFLYITKIHEPYVFLRFLFCAWSPVLFCFLGELSCLIPIIFFAPKFTNLMLIKLLKISFGKYLYVIFYNALKKTMFFTWILKIMMDTL